MRVMGKGRSGTQGRAAGGRWDDPISLNHSVKLVWSAQYPAPPSCPPQPEFGGTLMGESWLSVNREAGFVVFLPWEDTVFRLFNGLVISATREKINNVLRTYMLFLKTFYPVVLSCLFSSSVTASTGLSLAALLLLTNSLWQILVCLFLWLVFGRRWMAAHCREPCESKQEHTCTPGSLVRTPHPALMGAWHRMRRSWPRGHLPYRSNKRQSGLPKRCFVSLWFKGRIRKVNWAYGQALGPPGKCTAPGRNLGHLLAPAKPSSSLGRWHSTSQRGFMLLSYRASLLVGEERRSVLRSIPEGAQCCRQQGRSPPEEGRGCLSLQQGTKTSTRWFLGLFLMAPLIRDRPWNVSKRNRCEIYVGRR